MPLKGHQFDDKETVETDMVSALKSLPKTEFQDYSWKWKHQWERVFKTNRDYFERCQQQGEVMAGRILFVQTSYFSVYLKKRNVISNSNFLHIFHSKQMLSSSLQLAIF